MGNNGNLTIHFLNVGHGDCTIIEHPSGRISVIDINNGSCVDKNTYDEIINELRSSDVLGGLAVGGLAGLAVASKNPLLMGAALATSLLLADDDSLYEDTAKLEKRGYARAITNPIEYLEDLYTYRQKERTIFRYIQTHPDMDHMRGLRALLDHEFEIINFWDTATTKKTPDFAKVFNGDETDWQTYQSLRSGNEGAGVKILTRGSHAAYWSKNEDGTLGGDGIEILAPTETIARNANAQEKHNNHSYVLRLNFAGRSIILGGDAEEEVWNDILDHYGDNLNCDVLKASHHGRQSGFHQDAVKAMNPLLTICSVGKKPSTDASSRYNRVSDKVLSTRWAGNITVTITPQGNITYETQYTV